MVMLTSAQQMKLKMIILFLNPSAHNRLYGGGYLRSRVVVCLCEGVSVSIKTGDASL